MKPERTCIVSKETLQQKHMIRFVVGPDQCVVPDLRSKLPGRGVWIKNERALLESAIEKKLFSRGFKQNVGADPEIADLVDNLLSGLALGAFGFTKKAGACITGSDKVDQKIRNGKTQALFHAIDGAEDGLRKLKQAAYALKEETGRQTPIYRIWSSDQMNLALGATNVIHAALDQSSVARNCHEAVKRLVQYRGMEPS